MYFPPVKISSETMYCVVHSWSGDTHFVQHCQSSVEALGYMTTWHTMSGAFLHTDKVSARIVGRKYLGYESIFVHPDVQKEIPYTGNNNLHGAPARDVRTLLVDVL